MAITTAFVKIRVAICDVTCSAIYLELFQLSVADGCSAGFSGVKAWGMTKSLNQRSSVPIEAHQTHYSVGRQRGQHGARSHGLLDAR